MRISSLLALVLVACGGATTEIDDPGMQQTGAQLGEESGDLAEIPTDAEDSTVQSEVQVVGASLQSLVGQHQAYTGGATTTSVPSVDQALMAQDGGEPTVEWDGTNLVIDWVGSYGGLDIDYQVDLTFTSGDTTTIDGTYDLEYTVGVAGIGTNYAIAATYNALTINADGCAVGGSLSVSYDLMVDGGLGGVPGTNQSGQVVITYNGCDDVVIEGS